MKVIIAGPREFENYDMLCRAIEASGFEITEVVSGGCRGADKLGERWAKENGVPVQVFDAEWSNLEQDGAVIKERMNPWKKKKEKYNSNAGFYRNGLMAKYGEALIAIDGGTGGTGDMIKKAKDAGLEVFRYNIEENLTDDEIGYVFGD